jgi:hypothetical protein
MTYNLPSQLGTYVTKLKGPAPFTTLRKPQDTSLQKNCILHVDAETVDTLLRIEEEHT